MRGACIVTSGRRGEVELQHMIAKLDAQQLRLKQKSSPSGLCFLLDRHHLHQHWKK